MFLVPPSVTGLESVILSRRINMSTLLMINQFSGPTSDLASLSATTPETVFSTLVTDLTLSR